MVALAFPWIIVLFIIVALFLAIRKRFIICFVLCTIAFFLNWYSESFSFNYTFFWKSNTSYDLRVLSWNINGEYYLEEAGDIEGRIKMIRQEAPDIIYLAEDYWGIYMQVDSALKFNYPYSSFSRNTQHYFYSKYPILSCTPVEQDSERYASIEKVIIDYKGDNLVLYGCHLSSNNYQKGHIDVREGRSSNRFVEYFKAIPYASDLRKMEAIDIVIDMSDVTCIVMGDMNDVGGSPCMQMFANAGLRDAWWEGGFGYGATIHKPLPYRIDHIMYSDGLHLKSIKKVDANGLSDHDALVADFEIRSSTWR